MNILYICDEFPPGKTGGIGSVVNLLAKTLSAQHHNIYVIGLYPHGYGGADYEEQDNVKIWRLRYSTDKGLISGRDSLKDKIVLHAFRRTGILSADAKRQLNKMVGLVRSLVKEQQIDLIEMPDWNNFYFNIRLKDLFIPDLNVPLLVKMHGTASYFKAEQGLALSPNMFSKENVVYQRADAIAAVSAYTAQYCKDLYQLNRPVQVLYNGIHVNPYPDFQKRLDQHKVIFTGSLLAKKGIYALIKSWKDVLLKIPGATLHIYGKGNAVPLQALLDEGTRRSVFFYGHVRRETILDELRQADLAVFPSYSETFGLGAVEAMGAGCPVIYTKRSCGPEIVADGKEGLLVDPGHASEISDAIVMLLNNKALRQKLSLAAYEKVKAHFEIGAVAKQHISFYESVIAAYKAGH